MEFLYCQKDIFVSIETAAHGGFFFYENQSVTTCPVKCRMKLITNFKTATAAPLKLVNG